MNKNTKLYNDAIQMAPGKFQFTVLLQKRVRELVKGAIPLVKVESKSVSPIEIALMEFVQEKITFDDKLLKKNGSKS